MLLLAACGSDDPPATGPANTGGPGEPSPADAPPAEPITSACELLTPEQVGRPSAAGR